MSKTTDQKKILIIGAGKNQVPIINCAKNMGIFVIAVSPKGDYPGIGLADEWIEKDIFDVDGILECISGRQIDGVLSDQSDMAAPIVAKIAEILNLPNYGKENAVIFTDKSRMRELYKELNLNVPPCHTAQNEPEAVKAARSIGYPVVIKPSDSFASRGITLVKKESELKEAFDRAVSYSKMHTTVIEKYISGPQYFSQGFAVNGHLRLFAYSDRYYYDLENIFIPYTNAFPALIGDELKNEMEQTLSQIIEYLQPAFGHIWAEWIMDADSGKLYLIEMAIRGAGAYVTTDIIPRAYGVDTQPYLIKAALGESVDDFLTMEFPEEKAAAFFSYLLPPGTVHSVKGIEKVQGIKGVVKADIRDITVGEVIPEIENKESRYGLIVVEGKDRNELNQIHQRLIDTIQIQIKTQNGMKGAIWK